MTAPKMRGTLLARILPPGALIFLAQSGRIQVE